MPTEVTVWLIGIVLVILKVRGAFQNPGFDGEVLDFLEIEAVTLEVFVDEKGDRTGEMAGDRQKPDAEFLLATRERCAFRGAPAKIDRPVEAGEESQRQTDTKEN